MRAFFDSLTHVLAHCVSILPPKVLFVTVNFAKIAITVYVIDDMAVCLLVGTV